MKHFVGLRLLYQLKHAAISAKRRSELEEILFAHLFRREKTVCDRHPTERHESFYGRIADAAVDRRFLIHRTFDLDIRCDQAAKIVAVLAVGD